ncbi:MAG: exodeoxyribonuclease VII small subunit [Kurthia sp.]|nr:exodeoxyribonuclease VII small subunit [Candidatus Kurthia equi]
MTKKKQDFAESIAQLESIVTALEKGDVPLEEAIELYQEGMKLSQSCHTQLEKAEKQLVTIMDEQGKESVMETTKEEEA